MGAIGRAQMFAQLVEADIHQFDRVHRVLAVHGFIAPWAVRPWKVKMAEMAA